MNEESVFVGCVTLAMRRHEEQFNKTKINGKLRIAIVLCAMIVNGLLHKILILLIQFLCFKIDNSKCE